MLLDEIGKMCSVQAFPFLHAEQVEGLSRIRPLQPGIVISVAVDVFLLLAVPFVS